MILKASEASGASRRSPFSEGLSSATGQSGAWWSPNRAAVRGAVPRAAQPALRALLSTSHSDGDQENFGHKAVDRSDIEWL